jgi:hypothetical protein
MSLVSTGFSIRLYTKQIQGSHGRRPVASHMQQRPSDDGPKILLPEHASLDNIGIVSMQEQV